MAPGPAPGCPGTAAWAAGLAPPLGGGSACADSANTVTSDTRGSTIPARLDIFIFPLSPLPCRCSLPPVEIDRRTNTDATNSVARNVCHLRGVRWVSGWCRRQDEQI